MITHIILKLKAEYEKANHKQATHVFLSKMLWDAVVEEQKLLAVFFDRDYKGPDRIAGLEVTHITEDIPGHQTLEVR